MQKISKKKKVSPQKQTLTFIKFLGLIRPFKYSL
jgi:hypothetical protein